MKFSLILPYWDRQQAADEALALLEKTYQGYDLEVVIVDDGNQVPFKTPDVALNIRIVTLPLKDGAKCPATAWNAGVMASTSDIVVLSCVEILHEQPVLVVPADEMTYVLAAAWCPEQGWHCHSTVKVPDCPDGTGIAFCGMMYRSLFEKSGGFDEDYREGAGYEDRDFILRLCSIGAKFIIRDDLVVTHPKKGATIQWGAEKFARNEALYHRKWKTPVHFCCVNWGNYCQKGAQYVNNLYDMVRRNLPLIEWDFTCFTDDPTGIDCKCEPLPGNLIGWDNKLHIFKPGLFSDGERVIFLDLDTLIVGPLDDLLAYKGKYATLRDFWRPTGLGPAVISFIAGENTFWQDYQDAGRPKLIRGDQEWLERYPHGDILQDLYPDKFVSYKTHCHPYPPKSASVVCFHGEPRPHNCTQAWVAKTWKVGGSSTLNITTVTNTDPKIILENVKANEHAAPWLGKSEPHTDTAIICGSGPSLLDNLGLIKAFPGIVFALNNAAKVLTETGVNVAYQVLIDPRPENKEFLQYPVGTHLIASQVDPSIFEGLESVYQWHPAIEGIENVFPNRNMSLVGGGTTVGLSALALAYLMGFRRFALFGYDSSFRGEAMHASPQSRTAQEAWSFDVTVNDKTFRSNAAMAKQAELFPYFALELADLDCEIVVYGDGLLPYIAHQLAHSTT